MVMTQELGTERCSRSPDNRRRLAELKESLKEPLGGGT